MTREEELKHASDTVGQEYWTGNKDGYVVTPHDMFMFGPGGPTSHPRSQWISVEDRMPADGQKIVGHFTTAYCELDEVCHYPNNVIIDGSKGKLTRWFPFPEPIKEE